MCGLLVIVKKYIFNFSCIFPVSKSNSEKNFNSLFIRQTVFWKLNESVCICCWPEFGEIFLLKLQLYCGVYSWVQRSFLEFTIYVYDVMHLRWSNLRNVISINHKSQTMFLLRHLTVPKIKVIIVIVIYSIDSLCF